MAVLKCNDQDNEIHDLDYEIQIKYKMILLTE